MGVVGGQGRVVDDFGEEGGIEACRGRVRSISNKRREGANPASSSQVRPLRADDDDWSRRWGPRSVRPRSCFHLIAR